MLLNYFNLTEEPFGVTPDPRFLFMSKQHREAMASLAYGTESNRGFLALIGKPGMGKTSLLYYYLEGLRDKARTAFVFRSDCTARELIRHILLDLGVDTSSDDLPGMHETLNRIVTEEMNRGRRLVLVIDEAQNLDEQTLESVRLLSNFETPWKKLMQIVIAGQPGLAEKLARPSLTQLRQRISMVIRLEPFTYEDTCSYIDHRLWVAGCEDRRLFNAEARAAISEYSQGIPRNINNICFNALSLACALRKKTVDREIIREVMADLDIESLCPSEDAESKRPAVSAPATLKAADDAKEPKLPALRRFVPRMAGAGIAALALCGTVGGLNHEVLRPVQADTAVVSTPSPTTIGTPTALAIEKWDADLEDTSPFALGGERGSAIQGSTAIPDEIGDGHALKGDPALERQPSLPVPSLKGATENLLQLFERSAALRSVKAESDE